MAYTTINKSTDYFNTKTYTGNGGTNALTGVGFEPSLTWIKCRDDTHNPNWFDAVRGVTKRISSHSTAAESTVANSLTSFDNDGFTLGASGGENNNSNTYVAWNWKANGAGSANTDGSISSTVSVNQTAGFSIVSYTGTGSAGTIGHGLNAVPKMIISKSLANGEHWGTYHASLGNGKVIALNSTDGSITNSTYWNNTSPTTSVWSVGTSPLTNHSHASIAYCFAEKQGYSKFGKLISNGSDDGAFTYTGFAPKFVMLKPNVTDAWSNWYMFDTARDTNLNDKPLYANLSTQEAYYGGSPATNYAQIDILSNGFKIRRDGNWGGGGNGTELIYMAFGQSIVGSNNVPCTAR